MADDANQSFADRIAREGEDAVARLVGELSEQPLVRSLVERAFDARERAAHAQDVAFAALNIPSASDVERLTRRIRSVSLRMEAIEDGVDRLDERLAAMTAAQTPGAGSGDVERRLAAIERQLGQIATDVAALAAGGRGTSAPKPRAPARKAAAPKAGSRKPAAAKPASR